MFQKGHFKHLIFFLLFLCFTGSVKAQSPRSFSWETELDLVLPAQGNWAFSFGAANRYLFFSEVNGNRVTDYDQEHIELNHFTSYRKSENTVISLGLRYRFIETFEETRQDEFRIIEQMEYTHKNTFLTPEHRLRFEQRFREATIFRLRYQLGIGRQLNEDFGLGFSTEFLYSMQKENRPEMEQRFALELNNFSINNLELSLGIDMRREDFTGHPGTEFFLLTGATLQL